VFTSIPDLWTDKTALSFLTTSLHICYTVKVMLSLCLTKHHAMKMQWGVEVQLHAFLSSAIDGGEWSASRPGRFTPRKSPWYPLDRWLGGPRAGLDAVV